MKKLAFATSCFAMLCMVSMGAFGNALPPQVTLSQGTAGQVVFANSGGLLTATPGGTVGQCGHANCVSGTALLEPLGVLGRYTMWLTGGPVSLTNLGSGNFTVNMGSSTLWLEVVLGSGGSLGDLLTRVTLTDLSGGQGTSPQLDGTFLITASTVDFASPFPAGFGGDLDFIVKLPRNKSVTGLGSGFSVEGFVSTGELIPHVPEPSTLALVGTSLLGLMGAARRYRR